MINKKCIICGKEFTVHNYQKKSKYCSHKCYWYDLAGKKRSGRLTGNYSDCIICGKNYYRPKCRSIIKTCSRKCGHIHRKIYTKYNKFGERENRKCIECGKIYNLLKSTKTHKKFCSRHCYLSYKSKDVKFPQKQRLQSSEWIAIRRKILKKYKRKCYFCAKPANQVHHAVPYSISGDNSINNLVLLCKSCHLSIHNLYNFSKKYGIKIVSRMEAQNEV